MKSHYQRLVQTTQATVRQAERVLAELQSQVADEGHCLIDTLQTFLPRAQQVVDQTMRRVFSGEMVPPAEKLVSIFEPHTDIIRRGKVNKDTEFGHKVWLGEVEGGFIAQYEVLDGNPADDRQWQPTLEYHVQLFGRPPRQASADRGVHSADNEASAAELGVKRIVLPKPDASQRRVANTNGNAGSGKAGDSMLASKAGSASSSVSMDLIAVETVVKKASNAGLAGA